MSHGESVRRMYAGGRPNRTARFLNRIGAKVFSLGLSPHWAVTLETVSLKSGKSLTLPLVIARYRHGEYLVSMLGQGSRWVRNVRRAPGARPHIPVDRREPVAKFERIAADYPVFKIHYLSDG